MLVPDWNQKRPETSVEGLQILWEKLRIKHRKNVDPAVERLISAFQKTHVNGGAEFATFRIAGSHDFDWFLSRDQWERIEFPERFLRSHPVITALPEVCTEHLPESFGFESISPFALSGELAHALSAGGAYKRHEGGAGDAFAIAEDFRRWLFGDRFDEVLVLKSCKPWSAWFHDIAWDATWLIVDKRQSTVSVLAVTDTD